LPFCQLRNNGVRHQVVSFARGGRAAASGSFRRPDVEHYLEVVDQLSGEALTPAATARFIEQVIKET
jgi:hypothetical protein